MATYIRFSHGPLNPYETHRYTWGYYYVAGRGTVGNFPMISPVGHRHFYYYTPAYGMGDCQGVYYLSRASEQEVIKSSDIFLRSHDLVPDPDFQKENFKAGQKAHTLRYMLAHPDANANETLITLNFDVSLTTTTQGLLKVDYSIYFTPD